MAGKAKLSCLGLAFLVSGFQGLLFSSYVLFLQKEYVGLVVMFVR